MAFYKRFPKRTEGSVYPKWVEISLSDEEEREIEQKAREGQIKLFKECIEDAEEVASDKSLKLSQADAISIASELFDKRASHVVYLKERRCREKFDAQN